MRKSLYGLKKTPFMKEHAVHKTQSDHYVFVKKYDGRDFLIILLYVDDMLIVG